MELTSFCVLKMAYRGESGELFHFSSSEQYVLFRNLINAS